MPSGFSRFDSMNVDIERLQV